MNKLTKGAVVGAAILGGSVAMGGQAFASLETEGAAVGSPGVVSGNNIQVPINVPINLCGNTIDIIGILNPAVGNVCVNGDTEVETYHSEESHHWGGKKDDDKGHKSECSKKEHSPCDEERGGDHRSGAPTVTETAGMAGVGGLTDLAAGALG